MARRATSNRIGTRGAVAAAERRLVAFAEQWRPAPALLDPIVEDSWPRADHGDGDRRRLNLGAWSPAATRALAVLVAAGLALSGYWAWSGRPRAVAQVPDIVSTGVRVPDSAPGSIPTAHAAPAASVPSIAAVEPTASVAPTVEVVVHVVGLVARPGLVHLPLGARVADAVAAAGGVTRRRAADTVNLARVLVDGEQVVVGGAAVAGAAVVAGATLDGTAAPVPVDLNLATEPVLDGLPGVGPVLAGRIVAWRVANGPFRSVDELGEVSGIGDAILAQLRPLVHV